MKSTLDDRPRDRWGRLKKQRVPAHLRRELALRSGITPGGTVEIKCAYCPAVGSAWWPLTRSGRPGGWVAFSNLEIDHIVPESLGGPMTLDNLTLACRTCNRKKGARVGYGLGGEV